MTGIVNTALEATINLIVQAAGGQPRQIEAIVDTGFNGFLTLPPDLIASLGLPWLCRQQGLLAGGSTHIFDVYAGIILWDGQPRTVEVEAAAAQPLIGMGLMQGHDLRVQVVAGGDVNIAPIP